jgi:hypothetical protein
MGKSHKSRLLKQTPEVTISGKAPFSKLPTQVVNDKGRYRQQLAQSSAPNEPTLAG